MLFSTRPCKLWPKAATFSSQAFKAQAVSWSHLAYRRKIVRVLKDGAVHDHVLET